MYHEMQAMELQSMIEKINSLKSQLAAMESDFVECARGTSACFFCTNYEYCTHTGCNGCTFKWKGYN